MQTQTSNTLYNAIMEAGSKDRPPMLAPGNYVQWKSRIKRYIDTKPNHELIHHCLKNPPYKFTWADKEVPISEGSPVSRTESYMETYKTVSQDIRDQLNAKAEAVQIIFIGIDNDIYSTVDACPNALVQKSGIQCYNCKEFGHVAMECQKPKRAKDATYHREKMLLCKKEEAGIQLNAKQADWRDDTDDDELEDQELEAHYMYKAQLQEVSPDAANFGPIFDDEPVQKGGTDLDLVSLETDLDLAALEIDLDLVALETDLDLVALETDLDLVALETDLDHVASRTDLDNIYGESINVQDLETNMYWEFRKFTSQDGETMESYYSRFYKIMNELIRNQCKVTNHQVNVQFLLQLQPEWQRFVTLVKQSQELKTVSYHKLYDILKQHQHEVNEIRAEKIARVANPLTLVAQQQQVYHPQTHPTHYTQNSSTRSQQAATKNRGKAIKSGIQCYNYKEFGHVARECQKPKRGKDATNHREKMLLCKKEETGIQLNAEQADWRDDTDDDELEDQELEAHYMYMAQLQQVSPDAADSGPIFDDEPLKKVSNDNHYNVFAIESTHPEQSESVNDTYPIEQDAQNVSIDSLDMSYDREEIDQNDDDNDLAKEHELLASLIEKLKCEIEDFKNKNKSLESSNNFFKEANNRLSETNNLLYADYKKSEAELARRNGREYASQMELECAKVREMKDKLSAHQETISILLKQKEAQIKLYKTQEDKELVVYKTGQSVQTMNMLNNKCRTSFAKPEFLKKAQRANPRLYGIGCYNDNLALMLAPDTDEVIRLEKESRSKLSDLIRP
nr:hypothetical protein [Tanacetum cinerariifolium]